MQKEHVTLQKTTKRTASFFLFFFLSASLLFSAESMLKGTITDAKTGETLIGATVMVKNTTDGTMTDFDGNYELKLAPGKYTLLVSYVAYENMELSDIEILKGETTVLDIPLSESGQSLNELVVIGTRRLTSEVGLISSMRNATSVVSGISSQQITKNQDRDASEVIKRIPGISIQDGRFIVARGLAQRYNNVWLNNSATPSSEADTRSFSFDMIPSSQLENIMIIKSPQPELPADFSGGFVKVATKGIPSQNSMEISYGTGINTKTHFKDFLHSDGSKTDFLGFDNGYRELADFVPSRLDEYNTEMVDAVSKDGFNNDWEIKSKKPMPDQRFSFVINRYNRTDDNKEWGLVGALNYSYTSRTFRNMKNVQYGVYNNLTDRAEPENDYNDDQYTTNARLGAMLNLTFNPNNKNTFEFRNIFNQLGQDRYTFREGTDYTSGREKKEEKQEYLYASRTTYSGQFAGKHTLSAMDNIDWIAGFSYANKNQPDRRMINRTEYAAASDEPYNGEMYISQSGIDRNFIKLNEYIYNASADYKRDFSINESFAGTIKGGLYGEYKTRTYDTRDFTYLYNENYFPYSFRFENVVNNILIPENYGVGKLYIYETTNNVDSYEGNNKLLAAYLAANLTYEQFNVYLGARFEHNNMTLINYKSRVGFETKENSYKTNDVFPSINASYNLDKDNVLRLGYGMSVNRPEFREVSASSYYDFDIFNRIQGNPDLKPAYIHNFDIRYEYYPSSAELISVALFYKRFKDPIEWTFNYTGGGSRIYTFENALSANNFGVEIDIKKSLDFINLNDFSLVVNASFIDSKVKFPETSIEDERPLQGQSPYLVNAGLFYQNDKLQLTAGLMYNVIGKRIVGIGMKNKSEGSTINEDIPDMYEMPRNVFDFTISKRFGDKFELSAAIKDILAQKIIYKQFPKFYDQEGNMQKREQITKEYETGQNISVAAKVIF
ncbi:MAG: TonB-dependent receptor [Candidatus Azobacteroides sp.]|nr:TonB-dependent receptor [Candidatus Azobacteroides sp.]